ncbi:MAG: hypothetical protein RLZZ359_720 [Actinomycetota bacterium]
MIDLRSSFGHKFLLGLLGLLSAFPALSTDLYLPAFKQISGSLGVTDSQLQLTLAISFFGLALGSLFWGTISDRFGRKVPTVVGIGIFVIASVACALAPSFAVLLIARLFQSLGGSAAFIAGRAIIRDLYSGQEMARVMAAVMSIFLIAPILGPSLGAAILSVADWRWIFYTLAIIGGVAIACMLLLPETLELQNRSSLGGIATLQNYTKILRDREYVFAILQTAASSFMTFSYVASAPSVYMGHFGISETWFAVIFGANAVGLLAMTQINRRLLKNIKVVRVLGGMVIFQASSGLLLFALGNLTESLFAVIPLVMLTLSASPSIGGNSTTLALHNFKVNAAQASALIGVIQSLSATFVMSLLAAVPLEPLLKMLTFMASVAVLALTVLVIRSRELKARPVDLES